MLFIDGVYVNQRCTSSGAAIPGAKGVTQYKCQLFQAGICLRILKYRLAPRLRLLFYKPRICRRRGNERLRATRCTGSYELNESRLHFRPLASTRMACLEGMDQEQQFLYLLTVAMRYSIISSDNLPLYSGDERLVLRFKAIALQ